MTTAQFRTLFPEFADIARYTDSLIDGWIAIATLSVNPCRWLQQTNLGIGLYVAHEITIEANNIRAANNGGTPGTFAGIANNKTVGSVTVGYDTTSTAEKDAGYWNTTTYGKKYYRLVRIFGAGCVQL